MDTWTLGHLDTWTLGHLDTWTLGHLDTWTLGHLDTWTRGHMDTWTHGHLDTWTLGHLDTVSICQGSVINTYANIMRAAEKPVTFPADTPRHLASLVEGLLKPPKSRMGQGQLLRHPFYRWGNSAAL